MKVRKREGKLVDFKKEKVINAISKAGYVKDETKEKIAEYIEGLKRDEISVEEIQDIVEKKLMASAYKDVAKEYVRYRFARSLIRNSTGAHNEIIEIVNLKNQDAKEENSNKNPIILSTQRDYIAGAVSKELSAKLLFPKDLVDAHNKGLIHIHDMDYMIQHGFNCCLVNLEDILQNGTVINGTLIEKPHSFATACNIATQVMAQIASNQYGGQSESLSHLAPFVDISRKKIFRETVEEMDAVGVHLTEEEINKITEMRLKDEIKRGVQTMQYQINTLMTSNGQTPFVTLFMYLGEVKDERTKKDLAMIIEEVVRQRYQGTKNESGVYVSPAFPKLIYVLEEENIKEGSPYFYLTKMCAKCSAKRLVPDYISEKMMVENKVDEDGKGYCYPCMGCRSFLTVFNDEKNDGKEKGKFYGRLTA